MGHLKMIKLIFIMYEFFLFGPMWCVLPHSCFQWELNLAAQHNLRSCRLNKMHFAWHFIAGTFSLVSACSSLPALSHQHFLPSLLQLIPTLLYTCSQSSNHFSNTYMDIFPPTLTAMLYIAFSFFFQPFCCFFSLLLPACCDQCGILDLIYTCVLQTEVQLVFICVNWLNMLKKPQSEMSITIAVVGFLC